MRSERNRTHDQCAESVGLAYPEFCEQQTGLNRLSQSDFVGNQHTPAPVQHRERGLE
jgi:hypothetical protein